ncbi:MAG: hypothetical protein V1690_00790 [Candidatus Moraniibacteriota bacterium]
MKRVFLAILVLIGFSLGIATQVPAQNCGGCDFHCDQVRSIRIQLESSYSNPAIRSGAMNYSTDSSAYNRNYHWDCAQRTCNSDALREMYNDIKRIKEIREELPPQSIIKLR